MGNRGEPERTPVSPKWANHRNGDYRASIKKSIRQRLSGIKDWKGKRVFRSMAEASNNMVTMFKDPNPDKYPPSRKKDALASPAPRNPQRGRRESGNTTAEPFDPSGRGEGKQASEADIILHHEKGEVNLAPNPDKYPPSRKKKSPRVSRSASYP